MEKTEKIIREQLDEAIETRFEGLLWPKVTEVIEFSEGVSFSLLPYLEKDQGYLSLRRYLDEYSCQFDVGQDSYEKPSSLLADLAAAEEWLDAWYPGEKRLTKEACIEACSAPGKGMNQPYVLAAAAAFFNMPCTDCRGWSAKNCEGCSNTGSETCNYCKGTRVRFCPECNGHGGPICKYCLERGSTSVRRPCANCNGRGSLSEKVETWGVRGDGLQTFLGEDYRLITCHVCKGSGGVVGACSACGGNGSHRCKKCDCRWSPKPHSVIKCDECGGNGTYICRTCDEKSLLKPCKTCNSSGLEIDAKYLRQKLRMRFDTTIAGRIDAYCRNSTERGDLEDYALVTKDTSADFQRFATEGFTLSSLSKSGISRWLEEYCRKNIDRAVLDDCVSDNGRFSVKFRLAAPLWVARVSDSYFKDLAFIVYDPGAGLFYGLDQLTARSDAQRRSEEHFRREAQCSPLRAEADAVVSHEDGRPTLLRNYGRAIRALMKAESLGDVPSKEMLVVVRSKEAKSRKSRRTAGFLMLIVLMAAFVLVDKFGPKMPTLERFSALVANLKSVTPLQDQAVRLENALVATLASNPSAETEIAKVLSSASPNAIFGSPSAMVLLERHAAYSKAAASTLSSAYLTQCPEDTKACWSAASLLDRTYPESSNESGRLPFLDRIIYLYYRSGDVEKTVEWMTRAVESGVRPGSAGELAIFYQDKVGDCKKARYWREVQIRQEPAFSRALIFNKKPGGCFQ